VAAADHHGDLLALAVAAGVRRLRDSRASVDADTPLPWLPEFLRAAKAVMGEAEFPARALVEAAQMPTGQEYIALAACLSRIGGGQCPSPAVLGRALRDAVDTPAAGLVLVMTSLRSNTSHYCIEGA
jgi:hypothetical protein